MQKILPRILTLLQCLILSGTASISAQNFIWSAEFVSFFDNWEYKYKDMPLGTLFATRLTPTLGVAFEHHSISAGISWIQPIDSRLETAKFKPSIYYRYDTKPFAMSMGIFPRTQLIEPLDDFMCSDSTIFYSPNIQGALFQHRSDKGYVEALIDWRGIVSETTREAFMVVAQGRAYLNPWLNAGGAVALNHLALRQKTSPDFYDNVTDNFMIRPYVGVDFSHRTVLDSLTLRCGYLVTLDRERSVTDWIVSHAFVADLTIEWRFLGLRNKFYYGTPAMNFYDRMGSELYQGESYYRVPWHDRLDIYAYIFRNSFVNCFASVNFYFTPEKLGWQQQFVVRAYIDQAFKKRNKSHTAISNIFH